MMSLKGISLLAKSSLIVGLGLLFAMPLQAQSLADRLQRRLERKLERKLEQKVDDAIDRKFDEAEEKRRRERAEQDSIRRASGVKVTVSEDQDIDTDIEASEFTGQFTMETTIYKKGKMDKDSPFRMTYHVAPYEFAIQLPAEDNGEDITMIMDRRTRKITQKMDSKGERTAMITKMPRFMVEIEESDESDVEANYSMEATGRTKQIQGYYAEEYEIETEDYTGLIWVTEEVDIYRAMSMGMFDFKGTKKTPFGTPTHFGGAVLEAHYEHKTKDETSDFYLLNVREGRPDQEVFSLEGYEVTDMSRFQFGR